MKKIFSLFTVAALLSTYSYIDIYADETAVLSSVSSEQNYETISVGLTPDMTYAQNSMINAGKAVLYKNKGGKANGITVCVNAGHGTKGGESVKTLCHPDGSPKVTGGTTSEGATMATAVSGGLTFPNGTSEAAITLKEALILKNKLLNAGYNVLMIRETDDVQLDNVARTVIANTYADCHIAIHWDSTERDKGAFYCKVPNDAQYKSKEPVASTWATSDKLGDCLIEGLKNCGRKIFSKGYMELDLTQTAYSSVPSIDIECGDKTSDISDNSLENIADGLLAGVNLFYADRVTGNSQNISGQETTSDGLIGKTTINDVNTLSNNNPTIIKITVGSNKVVINDTEIEMDARAYIQGKSNSVLVPLRFAALALYLGKGNENDIVKWDNTTKTATIYAEKVIKFTADSDTMYIDGNAVKLENSATAELKDGRIYIPFRALGNALGVNVSWDNPSAIYTQ